MSWWWRGASSCPEASAAAAPGLACPPRHLGLRNAFVFSQYYSLKIKIKTYFVLGFVTILALFILNISGNIGMGFLGPRAAFLVEFTRGVFHPSLCTHILLSWNCPSSPRGWGQLCPALPTLCQPPTLLLYRNNFLSLNTLQEQPRGRGRVCVSLLCLPSGFEQLSPAPPRLGLPARSSMISAK